MQHKISKTILSMVFLYSLISIAFASKSEFAYEVNGKLFLRCDAWDWFEPENTEISNYQYEYYWGLAFLTLDLKYGNHHLVVEPQVTQMIDVPDDAFGEGLEGPLGIGAIYDAHNNNDDPLAIGLQQAYYEYSNYSVDQWKVRLGRFGYTNGMEKAGLTRKINKIIKMRIADRVISNIGWTAFWRSYNGLRLDFSSSKSQVTVFTGVPTEGAFDEHFSNFMEDIYIGTAAWTHNRKTSSTVQNVQGFYYYYADNRDCSLRVDNTGIDVEKADLEIHSLGGHYVNTVNIGSGTLDCMVWGMFQFGDWYEQDHLAYAGTLEFGYQFEKIPGKPWIRTGFFLSSGDSSPEDNDHETYFQLLPGTRKYELLPFYNQMNNRDYFVQLLIEPIDHLKLRMDYHVMDLVEENDLWYMGSGATQNAGKIFGYIGRPTNGETSLGEEWDFVLTYRPYEWIELVASYSLVDGGVLMENIYEDDNASYLMLETRLIF